MAMPGSPNSAPTNAMRMKIGLVAMMVCVVCSAALIGRLFYLQIIDGEKYKQMAIDQQLRDTIITPHRGSIYDTNLKTLAQSATVWNVVFEPANLPKDEEAKKKVLETLSDAGTGLPSILGINGQIIIDKAEANPKSYYEVLARKVDKDIFDAVTAFKDENELKCLKLEQDTKRYYPYEDLASTVLGFVNSDNMGAYGLESYYNKILTGIEGRVVSAKNALNGDMPFKYQKLYESEDGNSLVLTIDETIQHFAEKHLEIAVNEHEVKERAFCVVMDVKTGEILAMTTKPDFNPNEPRVLRDPVIEDRLNAELYMRNTPDLPYPNGKVNLNYFELPEHKASVTVDGKTTVDPDILKQIALEGGMTEDEFKTWLSNEQNRQWRNKVISDPYEPGSVFKLITASAALDSGSQSMESGHNCYGFKEVAGRKISCWKAIGHGPQTFTQCMMHSCNPAFIEIGQATGADNFTTYFDRFGLGETTGIDLPGEADNAGLYYTAKTMGISELSSASFGQTFRITPIQLITAVCAAINGGDLYQPYIVKQIIDSDKNIVESYEPQKKRQVISRETSALIRTLGEAVVHGDEAEGQAGGSGRNAAVPGYRIGGKTGTSEKLDTHDQYRVQYGNVLSFLGFAPASDPEVAVLLAMDEPKVGNAQSSTIAAPVVGAILEDILPYLGIEPSFTEEEIAEQEEITVRNYVGMKPHDAQSEIRKAGLKTEVIGNGVTILKQVPDEGKKLPYGGTVILYTDASEANANGVVPDVVGKTAYDANQLITNAGFNINIVGEDIEGAPKQVVSQDPPAGSSAPTGSIVTVSFQPIVKEEEGAQTNGVPEDGQESQMIADPGTEPQNTDG